MNSSFSSSIIIFPIAFWKKNSSILWMSLKHRKLKLLFLLLRLWSWSFLFSFNGVNVTFPQQCISLFLEIISSYTMNRAVLYLRKSGFCRKFLSVCGTRLTIIQVFLERNVTMDNWHFLINCSVIWYMVEKLQNPTSGCKVSPIFTSFWLLFCFWGFW